MLEGTISRHVYRKSLRALLGTRRSAAPPPPPPGGEPLVLYIHVPFCEELCGYCTFNRERFEEGLARRYFAALRDEIAMYHERGYSFGNLYIGGGTPTVLPEELAGTIGLVRSLWNPRGISVETHPDHLTEPVCALLEKAGVNRLSVGVQSFQDSILARLERSNRNIGPEEIRGRLAHAIERFRTVNVDMIFHVPGQTPETLRKDVRAIRELQPDQVTFYPLMRPHPADTRPEVPPRRLYALIESGLGDRYRVSSGWSFSLSEEDPIDEYITESDSYAGLGAGSFGYIDGVLYANTFSVRQYIGAVGEKRFPVVASKRFTRGDRVRYYSLMSLFNGRLEPGEAARRFGVLSLLQLLRELPLMAAAGGLRPAGRTVALTGRGRFLSLLMMREFFSAVSEFRALCRKMSHFDTGGTIPASPPAVDAEKVASLGA